MGIDPRRALLALSLAAAGGALLLLPAVFWIGNFLSPSHPQPAATPVPPLVAQAIWARANGGSADALTPLNTFTLGRMAACHVRAELIADRTDRQRGHEECMRLLPAVQAVGYLAKVHSRSVGVWQDPRVPFVQLATMARVSGTWTKAELIDTLAARGEFPGGFIGVTSAARGYFDRAPAELTLPQAALVAALLGEPGTGPWCDPAAAAGRRRRLLERLRDDLVIDEAALDSADRSPLGLVDPPAGRRPCRDE